MRGLHVGDKSTRVTRYHKETVKSFFEVLGAAGLRKPSDLKPAYIMKRVSSMEIRSYHELYPPTAPGALLGEDVKGPMAEDWQMARAESFNAGQSEQTLRLAS